MILFITGAQHPHLIEENLEELDLRLGIAEICGSAMSPCMDTVVPWAEENGVPVTLYFPESAEEQSLIVTNMEILKNERPNVVLSFEELSQNIEQSLLTEAKNSPSVEFIMRKI